MKNTSEHWKATREAYEKEDEHEKGCERCRSKKNYNDRCPVGEDLQMIFRAELMKSREIQNSKDGRKTNGRKTEVEA